MLKRSEENAGVKVGILKDPRAAKFAALVLAKKKKTNKKRKN